MGGSGGHDLLTLGLCMSLDVKRKLNELYSLDCIKWGKGTYEDILLHPFILNK